MWRKTGGVARAARLAVLALGWFSGWGLHAALAADKPVMTWMVPDLPPAFLLVNGRLTDGSGDLMLKMVIHEWPEVEHRVVITPISRALALLEQGDPACFPAAIINPERERMAYFAPSRILPPVQVVARADVVSRLPLNEQGEVLPVSLFDRSDLRGLVVLKRSYAPLLDAMLSQRSSTSGLRDTVAADSGSNILQMLNLGRADYTLEFDWALAYHRVRHPEFASGVGLKALPIAGTAPFVGGIACPRTEWGRMAIRKIDSILVKVTKMQRYRAAMNRWMTPEAVKRYQAEQAAFYLQRERPTDPAKFQPWPVAP